MDQHLLAFIGLALGSGITPKRIAVLFRALADELETESFTLQ